MQRYSSWNLEHSSDFWRDKFSPKDLLLVLGHISSLLGMRQDARLIERYDINYVREHSVGTNYLWVPIKFDDTPIYLGDTEEYPWSYAIDPNWIDIDALYDRHVDPTIELQHNIDFILKPGSICFVNKVEKEDLYISKGRYAEYRIYNEIGFLLNYLQKDSAEYRNSIEPILAAYYLGPTEKNLVAVLNVLIGLPVAKSDGELVLSVENGTIITDQNVYNLKGATTSIRKNDTLRKFQPLSNAIKLVTHKTEPGWWESKPVDLFSKYMCGESDPALRNYALEKFLYNSLACISINTVGLGTVQFNAELELLNLLYKALPLQSDLLYTQESKLYDYDLSDDNSITIPWYDNLKFKFKIYNLFGRFLGTPPGGCFSCTTLGVRDFKGLLSSPEDLTFNDYRWHIFKNKDVEDGFNEFTRERPDEDPYIEPNWDQVGLRITSTRPKWTPVYSYRYLDLTNESGLDTDNENTKITPSSDSITRVSGNSNSLDTGLVSSIRKDTLPGEDSVHFNPIQANIIITTDTLIDTSDEALSGWTFKNVDLIRQRGLSIGWHSGIIDETGEELRPELGYFKTGSILVGVIPKKVKFIPRVSNTDDPLAAIEIFYSTNGSTWIKLDSSNTTPEITGFVQFKVNMFANPNVLSSSPIIERLTITLSI